MSKHRYIIKLWAALFAGVLAVSCAQEDTHDNVVPEPGTVRIQLFTDANDYAAPATRIGQADEDGITKTPWVLVFQGTGDNAVFKEARQAFESKDAIYVELTENSNPCRLLIVANAPLQFYSAPSLGNIGFVKTNLENYFVDSRATFGAAMDEFSSAALNSIQTSTPYTGIASPLPKLPMTYVHDVPSIGVTTTIGTTGNTLKMQRIVAKVTVEKAAALSHFTLMGATVLDVPRQTRFYQRPNGDIKDYSGNTSYYLYPGTDGDDVINISKSTDGITTADHPIYIHESKASLGSSVIVFGYHDGIPGYYKLLFTDAQKKQIDILRNSHYVFKITKVDRAGYLSLAEARSAPEANIEYELTVADGLSHDIVANQEYYIGVTNSAVMIYDNSQVPLGIDGFAISTNTTTAKAGGIASITPSAGLAVSPTSVLLSNSLTATRQTNVTLTVTSDTFSSGTITIKVGDLTKVITVIRAASISTGETVIDFGGNLGSVFVIGEVLNPSTSTSWLKVSSAAVPDYDGYLDKVENPYGGIYGQVEQNITAYPRNGYLYLGREGNAGRVKVYVTQKGRTV